jgi:hypothetical protein
VIVVLFAACLVAHFKGRLTRVARHSVTRRAGVRDIQLVEAIRSRRFGEDAAEPAAGFGH